LTGATTVWYLPLTEGIANIIPITPGASRDALRMPSNLLPETLGVEAKWIILAACTVIQQLWMPQLEFSFLRKHDGKMGTISLDEGRGLKKNIWQQRCDNSTLCSLLNVKVIMGLPGTECLQSCCCVGLWCNGQHTRHRIWGSE